MFAYKAATSFCLSEERRRRTLAGTVYICLGAGVVTLCVAAVTYQSDLRSDQVSELIALRAKSAADDSLLDEMRGQLLAYASKDRR